MSLRSKLKNSLLLGLSNINLRFSTFLGVGDGYAVLVPRSKKYSTAQIDSKFIARPACLKFYFYLHGAYAGYLRITMNTRSNSRKQVFLHYGNHGNKWNVGQVYLSLKEYQVTNVCHKR